MSNESVQKFKQQIWVEKYRPHHVKNIVLPSPYEKLLNGIVESKDLPNLIMYSITPGTGKTTVAQCLIEDLGFETLSLNASAEGGIETLREDIRRFAQTKSLDGNVKIVFLDEADGLTPKFQDAFRNYIEKFVGNCRFILTCNNINKIIEPLRKGRVFSLDFNMLKPEIKTDMVAKIIARLKKVLEIEHLEYDEEVLPKFVENNYPSLRNMIQTIQQYSKMYSKIDKNILTFTCETEELAGYILEKHLHNARNYIATNGMAYPEVIAYMIKWVLPSPKIKDKQRALEILGQYDYQSAFSCDPSIQMACMFTELINLVVDPTKVSNERKPKT